MHIDHTRTASRGYSLLEVLVALALVTVGLLSAYSLIASGTYVNTDSKITGQAYQAAQQELELIRNQNFSAIQSLNSSSEIRFLGPTGTFAPSMSTDTGYPDVFTSLGAIRGSGTMIVQDDPVTDGNLLKHVTIIVRWKDRGGANRSVTIGTMVAKGGMDPQ